MPKTSPSFTYFRLPRTSWYKMFFSLVLMSCLVVVQLQSLQNNEIINLQFNSTLVTFQQSDYDTFRSDGFKVRSMVTCCTRCYQVSSMVTCCTRGGFLIRRSSAIRRSFAEFLRCDSRTMRRSFLKKIVCEFTGNLLISRTKFPENSRAIFLRNDLIIVRLSHLRNLAKKQRIAELRLM